MISTRCVNGNVVKTTISPSAAWTCTEHEPVIIILVMILFFFFFFFVFFYLINIYVSVCVFYP